MYLTAHLVHRDDEEGINAFLHLHGKEFPWPSDPERLPDELPGRTVERRTDLPPGGNKIRAYIDLLAPDGTPVEGLRDAVRALGEDLPERRNPTVFKHHHVTIRFGVEAGLERLRQDQYLALSNAAFDILATFKKRKGPKR